MRAAVIGLGAMGFGAAQSLLRAGIETRGCDLAGDAVERFAAQGGIGAATAAEAAAEADVILMFLQNAQQVRGVLFGAREGAVNAAEIGTVFLLNATMGPQEVADLCTDLEAAGMAGLDAPVIGAASSSAAGELTLLLSGPREAADRAAPVLQAIAARVIRLGSEPGQAARMKAVNQLLAGAHLAALAEAMVFAARQGLDLERVVEVAGESTGSSWMLRNRGPAIAAGGTTAETTVDVLAKDLGIIDALAGDMELPQGRAALALFRAAAEAGHGREADFSVARLLAERAGVDLPGGGS